MLHNTPGPDPANQQFGDAQLLERAKEFVSKKDKWISSQLNPVRDEFDPREEVKLSE